MNCKRCNRADASNFTLTLRINEPGFHTRIVDAEAALCVACQDYVSDEIGRLMVCANPVVADFSYTTAANFPIHEGVMP